jgi:hypothetical protein
MLYEEFEAYVETIEGQCADTSREGRIHMVDELIGAYVRARGEKPPGPLVERLSDVILYEELSDKRSNKMQLYEYPIMSEWQRSRRIEGKGVRRNKEGVRPSEVPISNARNVATNGIDYTPSKRSFANPF